MLPNSRGQPAHPWRCVQKRNPRFAGGAYSSSLEKVDRYSDRTLPVSLRSREDSFAHVEEIDTTVGGIITALQARGCALPYLRNYVVARINPGSFPSRRYGRNRRPMPIGQALTVWWLLPGSSPSARC
ncbi:MAG TPA: hypothetical protein VFR86_31945 [Burkholderiaceae bacterium]|nr:hypothetical protein [Burkholderiaceae bacterium]